jgi:hypothetical protein
MSHEVIKNEKVTISNEYIEAESEKKAKRTLIMAILCTFPIAFLIVTYLLSLKYISHETLGVAGAVFLGIIVTILVIPFTYSIFHETKLALNNNKMIKSGKYRIVEEVAILKEYPLDKEGNVIKRKMLTMKDEDGVERKVSAEALEYIGTEVDDRHYTVFIDGQDYYFTSFSAKKYTLN